MLDKKGQITKDLKNIKNNEANDLAKEDFFISRDKGNRGSKGLVDDAKKTLEKESLVKESLYNKSMQVDKLPPHIKPMFGGVFLTARRNKTVSDGGVFLPTAAYGKGDETDMDVDFSDKQIVLAKGPHAQQVEEGNEVVLNMDNFKQKLDSSLAQKLSKEFRFVLPVEIIDGVEYLYVSERDIKYISNNNSKID